ncbi:hypothetical protein PUN28_001890 [Cardiocondyla obscurior]|uniref:Uncharacterized protein n=1 Tax=Cardiocondyla obscurior TaxID=286306 RepID=A0AAW2GRU5_9HYME
MCTEISLDQSRSAFPVAFRILRTSLISAQSQSRLNEFDLIASSINGGTFHRSYLPEHVHPIICNRRV